MGCRTRRPRLAGPSSVDSLGPTADPEPVLPYQRTVYAIVPDADGEIDMSLALSATVATPAVSSAAEYLSRQSTFVHKTINKQGKQT